MDGFSGPSAPPAAASFLSSHSPTPSPSPSHSASASLTLGSGQKRKRTAEEHASSLTGNAGLHHHHHPHHHHHHPHPPHTFSNLHPSSVSHESRDGPGTSLEEDDENVTGGGESGQNHSQLDSISAGDPDGRDEFDEEDEDDGNEDDGDQDDEDAEDDGDEDDEDAMRTFTTARLEGAAAGGSSRSVTVKAEGLQNISNVKIEHGGDMARDFTSSGPSSTVQPEAGAVKEEPNKLAAVDTIQTSGAYCSREENFKREEDAGRLKFVCYSNDGVDQHMIWLIGLKNIFARQLPNMPKEYIVRLVMDRSHKSMMIIKLDQVVGGITYRPYSSQRFGEIAFCAVTADEQVKGYGTRLMNHLKQHARDADGLTDFLTYRMDYEGGTLMECKIDPKLPYTDLPAMIRLQRQAIDAKIRELSNCHVVHQGIEIPKKEAGIPRKPFRIEDIPGLKDAGWSPEHLNANRVRLVNSLTDGPPSRAALYAFMRSLLKVYFCDQKAVAEHADAWPFKEPVDPREVPDYYDIIKDPVDLRTISKRLESEIYYLTLDMFAADMRRMFANARTYNSPETIYFKCANRLEALFSNKLQAGLHTSTRT